MTGHNETPEIVKWYTRARKFPQLIGKTADGTKLWGGPYTYTQVIGAAAVLVVGLKTTSWWGSFGLIGNALVALGAAYGTALLLGRLPIGSRNPISVGSGTLRALTRPAQGTLGGAPLRIRRPHRARTALVIRHTIPAAAPTAQQPPQLPAARPPEPAPTTQRTWELVQPPPAAASQTGSPRPPALTGVQRLLAASSASLQED